MRVLRAGQRPGRRVGLSPAMAWLSLVLMSSTALTAVGPFAPAWANGGNGGDALAGADGLFITKEIGGDSVDLVELFKIHARAIYATALAMVADNES